MSPLFSIGITTYNRPEMLKECIQSIVQQTFDDYEIIVGNDYTKKPLTRNDLGIHDSRLTIVNNAKNLGELENMNSLLYQAKGRYFTWLADDDMYTLNLLLAINNALIKFDYPKCVFTSYMQGETLTENVIDYSEKCRVHSGRSFLRKYLSGKIKAIGCYGIFDIEYLKKMGGIIKLGTGFSPYSDNLLAIQCSLLDKVIYLDAPLIFYRNHQQSISICSSDSYAYKTAQEDLIIKCIEIFKNPILIEDLNRNVFDLLNLFISNYFSVLLYRSSKIKFKKIYEYSVFIFINLKWLKKYKYKLILKLLKNIIFKSSMYYVRQLLNLKSNLGKRNSDIRGVESL